MYTNICICVYAYINTYIHVQVYVYVYIALLLEKTASILGALNMMALSDLVSLKWRWTFDNMPNRLTRIFVLPVIITRSPDRPSNIRLVEMRTNNVSSER